MTKRNKIIYWSATIWLALGMTVTGAGQLIKMKAGAGGTDSITHLGYPVYILTILGVWKILGVVTVLLPKFPLLKEWAYAGFFFLMTGAVFSHLATGDAAKEFLGPALLLTLTGVSWYFRPSDRKVIFSESIKEEYEHVKSKKEKLSPEHREALLSALKDRFEKHAKRHRGLEWAKVQAKLEGNTEKLWSLNEME